MNGVSIVICCYNGAKRLPKTLSCLLAQQAEENIAWEVLLIDNASSDGTADIAQSLWPPNTVVPLHIIREEQRGFSHARRRGLMEARFECVSFIDDDNWVDCTWVNTAYQFFQEHPTVGACGGESIPVFEIKPPDGFNQFYGSLAVGQQAPREGDVTESRGWLWGAGLTIRKSAWEQISNLKWQSLLLDRKGAQLSSGGDNEICYWLRLLGWRLYYVPKLRLHHFLPEERLSWLYLQKMVRTNGTTAIIDNAYKRLLREKKDEITRSPLRMWLSDVRANFTNLVMQYQVPKQDAAGAASPEAKVIYLARRKAILWNLMKIGPYGYKKLYGTISRYHVDALSIVGNR